MKPEDDPAPGDDRVPRPEDRPEDQSGGLPEYFPEEFPEDVADEAFVSSLIDVTNQNMPAPDPDFLARLKERSTEAFLEAVRGPAGSPDTITPAQRNRPMLSLFVKAVSACIAAFLMIAAGLWTYFMPHQPQVALGSALDRLSAAQTLQLTVHRDGSRAAEVLYSRPGLLRWNDSDGTYKIAHGDTMWQIDEKDNRATHEPATMFTDTADGPQLDLLALLDSSATAWDSIATEFPIETIVRDGRQMFRYGVQLAGNEPPLMLHALVDAATKTVTSLEIQTRRNGRMQLVAGLTVVAVNAAVAPDKFVVRDTLTEDGRIGMIAEVQGLVSLKPVMHERWTTVCGKTLLRPGDWVRTDNRGANAAVVKLVKQSQLILGPGSLVEVVSPTQVRVHTGELEATVGEGDTLNLVGPDNEKFAMQPGETRKTHVFRVKNDKLAMLDHEPPWLKGFKGTAQGESIGSLIAQVDGRAVPLTVGYHTVTVDIRDQIARTVIEESFVNHTLAVLEGVFYFPLPDDASISGFGMWIGNELVEADIVEKQRAREIYETILRERRDPGLLEWTGGNLFKARVFPIPQHAEKRIKISYTQVLPARGNSYRYSYALQSELLKLHPLRELSIDVKVNSATPLKNISSPTHTVRADQTAHSAHVEFSAQEYTPTRDFEVVIETDRRQADLVLIPHRRGDDGYFMLQFTPPAAGDWRRDVLPDGEPLELLILADTSASMDAGQRRRQSEVVAALLAALGPRDTVNLAGCDVDCDWVFEKPTAAEPDNVARIRSFLEKRQSLGWTDLDQAFAAAFRHATAKTQIIYIGDGIVTTGDARPEGFAQRVKQAYSGQGTCHAVAVGSSFEPAVLKAIAGLGGGSLRRVSGEEGPTVAAAALLREIAQPALRDLKVEFRGFQAARVYPEQLTNLPAGSQQILLGLYQPGKTGDQRAATGQKGEVLITATQDGKPVKFSAPVSFDGAEQGNSFIPRLWAKMHLDSLLAQGASASIRDEVIALSEEFQIMTPYTSFLVLESDADRERFKVQRRFRMRDGEKYFQEGRDNANFELVQQQVRRAGNWRLGLRRMALARLALLGRDARLFTQHSPRMAGAWSGPVGSTSFGAMSGLAGGVGGGNLHFEDAPQQNGRIESWFLGDRFEWAADMSPKLYPRAKEPSGPDDVSDVMFEARDAEAGIPFAGEMDQKAKLGGAFDEFGAEEIDNRTEFADRKSGARPKDKRESKASFQMLDADGLIDLEDVFDRVPGRGTVGAAGKPGMPVGGRLLRAEHFGRRSRSWISPDYLSWVDTLFPALPPAETSKPGKPRAPTWPDAVGALSNSLLRTDALAKMTAGLEIVREAQSFEPRWNELTSRHRRVDLFLKDRWLTRTAGDNAQTIVNWADGAERGVMGLAFGLGQVRKSQAVDLSPVALDRSDYAYLGLNDHSLAPLHEAYREYVPTIERQDGNRTWLILNLPRSPQYEIRVLIDTTRHVIISIEQRQNDKPTLVSRFDDFVEVAGSWWARRLEVTDSAGRRLWLVTQTIAAIAADALGERIKSELAIRERVQLLHVPLPAVKSAKQAQARLGELTFEDQFVLLLHFIQSQQWEKVFGQLAKCEQLSAGKSGVRWIRYALWAVGRRHEELKVRLLEEARNIAAGEWSIEKAPAAGPQGVAGDEQFLAEYVLGQAGSVLEANENLALLASLKAVYERQPAHRHALKGWQERRIGLLQNIGRPDDALREQKQLASENPRDYGLQQRYAQNLFNNGDYDAAYGWLTQALAAETKWHDYESDSLRSTYASFLQQQGRNTDLAQYLGRWIENNPDSQTIYQQYLSALIQSDQVPRYEALLAEWLKPGTAADELTPVALARLNAAISLAFGHGYYVYADRLDEKWQAILADVVLATARSGRDLSLAQQIMGQWRFQSTDECRRVRGELVKLIVDGLATIPPDRLQAFLNWVTPNDPPIAVETWKTIATGLRVRWGAEQDAEIRHALGGVLVSVITGRLGNDELLAFLREQLASGPAKYRASYANQLFDALLTQVWGAPLEDEALSLLERLSDADEPGAQLRAQVAALYRLTDAMVAARHRQAMNRLEQDEQHKQLHERERRKVEAEQLQLARQGFADRLQQEQSKRTGAIVAWLEIERLYLDTLTRRDLPAVAAECWELLVSINARRALADSRPANAADREAEPDATDSESVRLLDAALQIRCESTLLYLATRPDAPADLVARLRKYLADKLAAEPDVAHWKTLKFQLLLALDKPQELRQALTAWMNGDDADSRWRLALGYVLAELGSIPEAIALFEAIEIGDELGPQAYRALAGWYLAANRRADYERAQIRVYQTLDEWRMNQFLQQQLYPWQQNGANLPSQLDQQVLLMFTALFEKSGQPQNYLGQLQQFYQASHDFRLLAVLAESVVGHSAGQVYPFLQGMRGVLTEIRDEATADQLRGQIAKVRERAKTTVDKRALDLLEAQVERRAAEVQNQPGPHVVAAVAALQRAFEREWSDGEQRLMADLLAGLGMISQKPLADEQLRQLQALFDLQPRRTYDRLHVGHRLAELWWSYSRQDAAVSLLRAELAEFQDANGGLLPVSANSALAALITFQMGQRHYVQAEKTVLDQLTHPVHGQQRLWLVQRQFEVYQNALQNDGEVSVGSGQALFQAFERKLFEALQVPDQNHRHHIVNQLCGLYRTASDKKLAGAKPALLAFAARVLPGVLSQQTSNYTPIVNQVSQTIYHVAGVREALAFLIERIVHEPGWFRFNNQDAWAQFGYTLSQWRYETKNLGDLEARLLKIVLTELRRDLESQQQRNRNMFYGTYDSYFWKEKAADFARTAEAVYADRKQSGAAVQYIADYLFFGLGRTGRAIEILFIAHREKLLNEAGISKLAAFLFQDQRYGESIAVLEPLIDAHPDNIGYRSSLMQAYFHTNRKAELQMLLATTDEHFHRDNRWTEQVLSVLAGACLTTQLYADSVKYYKELIPLHEESQPRRGIGNGTLSNYYANLSAAYAGLKQTAEAVDAACGAIISWGPAHANRVQAIESLKHVLRTSPDLDAYIAVLDKATDADGADRPIVRKALGQVLLEKSQFAKAIVQLQRAVGLDANDPETQKELVACYDKLGDRAGAIEQILRLVDVSRREITLFQNLADRYTALELPREAERANTSIVEALPSESESHALLAEIRQKQNRWPEAIVQWEQVARIRALEPTGLLRLAAAQVHEQQFPAARETLKKLDTTPWPPRFGDVHNQVRELERQMEAAPK
jgi:Flp pilus assembly protein TadD